VTFWFVGLAHWVLGWALLGSPAVGRWGEFPLVIVTLVTGGVALGVMAGVADYVRRRFGQSKDAADL
jgi:hypothetical protein